MLWSSSLPLRFQLASATRIRSIALVSESSAVTQSSHAGRNSAMATAARKITMNGQDKNARYRLRERLCMAQRSTFLVIAGAWSVDLFLKSAAAIALYLNLLVLAVTIAALALQVALMRK